MNLVKICTITMGGGERIYIFNILYVFCASLPLETIMSSNYEQNKFTFYMAIFENIIL